MSNQNRANKNFFVNLQKKLKSMNNAVQRMVVNKANVTTEEKKLTSNIKRLQKKRNEISKVLNNSKRKLNNKKHNLNNKALNTPPNKNRR